MQMSFEKFRPSILHLFVFAFFAALIIVYILLTGDFSILPWAIPTLVLLILIPMGLTYLSQDQYSDLIPEYEKVARDVKIREITEAMISKPIRIEGLVEEVRFQFLNRPHFVVGDKTGVTTVKMFTNPHNIIKKGDIVEVYGQVIRRYIFAGDPIVNGVEIRKTETRTQNSVHDEKRDRKQK